MDYKKKYLKFSLIIISSRTHFFKIGFVVARGVFYFYYILQGNLSDKERRVLSIKKDLIIFLKMGAIPRGCNSTSTLISSSGDKLEIWWIELIQRSPLEARLASEHKGNMPWWCKIEGHMPLMKKLSWVIY